VSKIVSKLEFFEIKSSNGDASKMSKSQIPLKVES
jgi:hypothetical protein